MREAKLYFVMYVSGVHWSGSETGRQDSEINRDTPTTVATQEVKVT